MSLCIEKSQPVPDNSRKFHDEEALDYVNGIDQTELVDQVGYSVPSETVYTYRT